MSDEVKHLNDHPRRRKSLSISDAIKRAKQHLKNVGADDLQEPEGFSSGDMKKFLEDPDKFEQEEDDEKGK